MDSINLSLILVLLAIALFDFTNGFHDAADLGTTESHSGPWNLQQPLVSSPVSFLLPPNI